MNICIARLRSFIHYTAPLDTHLDAFCHVLQKYVRSHPEHNWSYYGFSFERYKPQFSEEAIRSADVIIILSDAEFLYHTPGRLNAIEIARSEDRVQALGWYIADKKVINLRFDRRDDEELYKKYTWPDINFEYREIDEIDFPLSINALKPMFFRNAIHSRRLSTEKRYDAIYWGTDKSTAVGGGPSGDVRHIFLKEIDKSSLSHYWIGLFRNMKADKGFSPMSKILPDIVKGRFTFCFNWLGSNAPTARYFEAIGAGVIPLVYEGYGCDVLPIFDWQRVHSAQEAIERITSLRGDFDTSFSAVEQTLMAVIPPEQEYIKRFDNLLSQRL